MKVLKTDISIYFHSLRNIDIVTEGFMFLTVNFERPQPPGLLAVRANKYVSTNSSNTYLHPEYPPASYENGMRTAIFALRYADQLINLNTQLCFSLFHIYDLDCSSIMTISLYGKAKKTETMPSKEDLPLSSFKRLTQKRYCLNSILLPCATCFSEHISYTFFSHLSTVISWYPIEVLTLSEDKITAILSQKTNCLDSFLKLILSVERTLQCDDLISVVDSQSKKSISLEKITNDLDDLLSPPMPTIADSVQVINSALFNSSQKTIDIAFSQESSTPVHTMTKFLGDEPKASMPVDHMGNFSGGEHVLLESTAHLKRLLSQSNSVIDSLDFLTLKRSTLIFFKIFYLNKIAGVGTARLLDTYVQKYNDLTEERMDLIYLSECKKYTKLILESSEASLAAAIYDTLTSQFESRLHISSLESSVKNNDSLGTRSAIDDLQECRAPVIKQKRAKSTVNTLDVSTHSNTSSNVDVCTSDSIKALLQQETLKLKATQSSAGHLLRYYLNQGAYGIAERDLPFAKKRSRASSKASKARRGSSPVVFFPPVSESRDEAKQRGSDIEAAMMKTIKDSMALSNAKLTSAPQDHQIPQPPTSLLAVPGTNSVKSLLSLIEQYRDSSFPIDLVWSSDSSLRVFTFPPIFSLSANTHKESNLISRNAEEPPSMANLVKQKRQSKDLYVFAHGYRGTYCDLRLMSNCILQYAVIHGTRQKHWFPKQPCILLSKSYQRHTQNSILELGVKLAEEIRDHIQTRKVNIGRINMIGHSMGCLVIEACILSSTFSGFLGLLNKAVFLNGPLAGAKGGNGLVRFGMTVMSSNSKEVSLRELMGGKLTKKQVECIYYNYPFMKGVSCDPNLLKELTSMPLLEILAKYSNLNRFESIYMISSLQDGYVDFKSALLLPDNKSKGSEKEKHQLFLDKVAKVPTKRLLYDLSVLDPLLQGSTKMDRKTGRDAHIVHMSDYNLMHTIVQEVFGKDMS